MPMRRFLAPRFPLRFLAAALLVFHGIPAAGIAGAAEPGVLGPILVGGGVTSPDGDHRLLYWSEEGPVARISMVRIMDNRRGRIVWKDGASPDHESDAYSDVSGLWSPGGTRLAVMFTLKPSQWTVILERKDGRFVQREIIFPKPPLAGLFGKDFVVRRDGVKAVRWRDEDTLELVYSGAVEMGGLVAYECGAVLGLREGKVVFGEMKKERVGE